TTKLRTTPFTSSPGTAVPGLFAGISRHHRQRTQRCKSSVDKQLETRTHFWSNTRAISQWGTSTYDKLPHVLGIFLVPITGVWFNRSRVVIGCGAAVNPQRGT
ncbi:MAG: hypothetical protein KF699_07885, partial [Phycisphaeraceae bacterium]|nr:hypothetical protein [Phycisphaeraceae bacterium]